MKVRISVTLLFFLINISASVYSQIYSHPNVALKSHETLFITKVELTPQSTMISLSVENQRAGGGSFCADKNISVFYPDGSRLHLTRAINIPVCPKTHSFKTAGEKLHFTLEFPPLRPETKWIDIIEDCPNNCFWLYGITLDNKLNGRLDNAFDQAADGRPADNILLFKDILDDIDNQNLGIEGLLYINIINAALEDADRINMSAWYKRFTTSQAPRLDQYIKYLNDKGIKF